MASPRYDKEIIDLLQKKVLPWWEQFGVSHAAVSAHTLREFNEHSPPATFGTYVKKRRSKRVAAHGPRYFDNTSYAVARWPKDGQWSIRYPALVCVLEGTADFHIADYVVQCPQSHFFLFAPHVPYPDGQRAHFEGDNISERSCRLLWFMVPPGMSDRISCWSCHSHGKKHWQHQLFDYCLLNQPETVPFFNLFLREMLEKPAGYRELADISFRGFLQLFLRDLRAGHFSHAGETTAPEIAGERRTAIDMALMYIENHLTQPLTLEIVARNVFMSRTNFSRQFAVETGQTFHQYLTARRLKEAKRWLCKENWAVASVSRLVGVSPAQLYNLFMKYEGCAPSEFQKRALRELQNQETPAAAATPDGAAGE